MNENLDQLRARLDRIDGELLESLRARLACCAEIGRYKKEHGIAMMQPGRIGVVKDRAAAFGRTHGISEAFLHQLYDVVIAETCRLETEIIDGGLRP
jgi:4-amino-4-deoxychorismate mutase